MTEVQQKRICSRCGAKKESLFCSSCQTDTLSKIIISISATINLRTGLEGKKFGQGIKKVLIEFVGGWFKSGDHKLPNGVYKVRTIDREKNEYHEVVKKYGTEDITHEMHEPLCEHR